VRLALGNRWWIEWRDVPEIQTALTKSHLLYWVPRVHQVLNRNKATGARPSTWQALADEMYRGWTAVWRWRTGENRLAAYDFQCLASILDVPLEEFFPSIENHVAGATLILCKPTILHSQAAAYAAYRFSRPRGFNPHLDSAAIRRVLRKMKGTFPNADDVESAILKTAQNLEVVLQTIGSRLK
jgi:hypothetical protein